MNSTRGGWLLVAAGVIVLALSALADPLGLGGGGALGWKQATGLVVGALVAAAGAAVLVRSRTA